MDLQFLEQYGRVLLNIKKLLNDRHYDIFDNPIFHHTDPFQIISALYLKALEQQSSLAEAVQCDFRASDAPSRPTITVLCFDRNYDNIKNRDRMISTDQVKNMQDLIKANGIKKAIVISPNKLSPQAKKETLSAEIFSFDDLIVDLPRHDLVLKHSIITAQDLYAYLGRKMNVTDLPVLPISDPVCRWFGFQPGQIVFIENPLMPSFRIVGH